MTQINNKSLYFAIDGTILDKSTKAVKKNLQNGQLELRIRNADFNKLFCIGNVNKIFNGLEQMGQHVDSVEIVYTLCFDAFTDFDWFVSSVCCTKKSDKWINQIDFSGNWWYMDILAEQYLKNNGKNELFKQQKGNRILIPNDSGDGNDIITWLDSVGN